MPTYQYQCPHCGHEFERFQSITEPPVDKCPKCSKKPRRLITGGAGFLLKGSGFYTTDYRSESYKAAARKESQAATESKGEGKEDGKKQKESKPKADKAKES
jgi:putative FmdB family regulatory protein